MAADSAALTLSPPKPRNPPSLPALATLLAIATSQLLNPAACSAGTLPSRSAGTFFRVAATSAFSCSGVFPLTSKGGWRRSPFLAISLIFATIEATIGFAAPSPASMMAWDGAKLSLRIPIGPVRRSERVTNNPASNGVDLTSAQSSGGKFAEIFVSLIGPTVRPKGYPLNQPVACVFPPGDSQSLQALYPLQRRTNLYA